MCRAMSDRTTAPTTRARTSRISGDGGILIQKGLDGIWAAGWHVKLGEGEPGQQEPCRPDHQCQCISGEAARNFSVDVCDVGGYDMAR